MKIKVPKTIKIASYDYDIKFNTKELLAHGTQGLASHIYKSVTIDNELHPTEMRQVLLHEILHCIERAWTIKIDDADIDRIAEGISMLLFDEKNFNLELDWSDIPEVK